MRREKRPFLVEVKKGQKRAGVQPVIAESELKPDQMRRAEAAFASADAAGVIVAEPPSAPPRRILEALAPEPQPAPVFEPPRRGRKPGSKNRPKQVAPVETAQKRPRGRPRRYPDGQVRNVTPTAEVARAALQSIAKAGIASPVTRIPGGHMHPVPMFEPAPKRKRGRPRKVRTPKFDWTVWTAEQETDAPATFTAPVAVPVVVHQPVPALDLARFEAAGPRLRAGERWKRRLRVPGGGPLRPRDRG